MENKPKLPETLRVLQYMRTEKAFSESALFSLLDKSLVECKKNDIVQLLERVLLHIGDISRQHNILSELGIKSENGGAQERKTFRSVLKWWETRLPESFAKNVRTITEFTVLENIMFYENKTDRKNGKLLSTEINLANTEVVFPFLANEIRMNRNLNLIAKHLPKYSTGKTRTTTIEIKNKKGRTTFNLPKNKDWYKVNGEYIQPPVNYVINVKPGDIVSYARSKQEFTINKQRTINKWIYSFCKYIGWTLDQYKSFRSLQNTAEQAISSKKVLDMPKSDFVEFLNKLTAGQRFRVSKTVCYKDGNKLVAKPEWNKLGEWFIEWENAQTVVAQKLRDSFKEDNPQKSKELLKELKVKATGMQTIDMLVELIKGGLTTDQIDNTYQAMVERMDLIANVFVIVDGSASMDSSITNSNFTIDRKYERISRFDIAAAMCVTFSTRNPVEHFRNTFGWFSSNFTIVGKSKYVNDAPNQYVSAKPYTKKVNTYNVLSESLPFTENFKNIKKSNPGIVSSTNMFASVEYFVDLVKQEKLHAEDLPNALLYITDNERNGGKTPKQAQELALSIGWNPLFIFWGLQALPPQMEVEAKNMKNLLLVGGFSESVLSQILRGIKSGAIDPEDELWSIYENKRYSVIGYDNNFHPLVK